MFHRKYSINIVQLRERKREKRTNIKFRCKLKYYVMKFWKF